MRDRISRMPQPASKNQEVSITLADGRTFAVCSKGQYRYVVEQARNQIVAQMIDANELTQDTEANDAIIRERLSGWCENKSKYATMDWIMDRMNPSERNEWKQKYRFGGIKRKVV